jgi:coenzyme Q-binding protein COQ10
MPMFRTTRRVPFTSEQMFALVADVERYPEFLPLCTGLNVRRRLTTPAGQKQLVAAMSVGYKAISETFTSRVTLDEPASKILVEFMDGPFRHLENRWSFLPLQGGGCEIVFFISYEFASRTLGLLMGTMFDRAFRKFAEAFEQRAVQVYGPGTATVPVTGT